MPSIINALSTGSGGLVQTADASGVLQLQTNNTTALTVDTNANVTFPGYISAPNTFGFKNRIINGDMRIDQRNAGASMTLANGGSAYVYTVDRWAAYSIKNNVIAFQQNAGGVTPPSGFTNYVGATSLAATTVASGDITVLKQPIEAFNTADFNLGTANASAFTVSFWVRSSLTGTFGGALSNSAVTYIYPFSFVINSANTWEYKTITVTGPTAGTWVTGNSAGLQLFFSLGTGSTFLGTANTWQSSVGGLFAPTGSTNLIATNGATFYITGVQLEKGSTATPFDYRPYGTELALCQRYAYTVSNANAGGETLPLGTAANSVTVRAVFTNPVPMRAAPTFTLTGAASNFNVSDIQTSTAVTAIALVGATTQLSSFNIGVASGLTQFRPYFVEGGGSSQILLSAEL